MLAKIPNVMVVHGEADGTLDHMKVCYGFNYIYVYSFQAFPLVYY